MTGDANSDSLDITWRVLGATVEGFEILGLSAEDDGTAEFPDADQDEVLDGAGINVDCNTPSPNIMYVIVNPAGTYSYDKSRDTPGFEVLGNKIEFLPTDCPAQGSTLPVNAEIAVSDGIEEKYLIIPYNVTNDS